MRAIYHALFINCSFAAVVGCRPGTRQSPGAQERVSQSEIQYFRIWPWAAYPSEVRARYHGSDRDGIRAVVGDFNGDGRLDVALDGSDHLVFPAGAGEAIVAVTALLTSGDDAIAVRVTEGSLVPGDSADVPRPRWLLLVAAGTFRSGLATDAVGMPLAREAGRVLTPSQVYFWSGDRPYFVQWSDGE